MQPLDFYSDKLLSGKEIIGLTTWEGPEHGPVWPSGVKILKSEAHDEVQIGIRK